MRKKTIGEKWERKRLKKGVRYQSVSLSVPFIKLVKEHIKDDPMYRSIADYVRESIREKINRDNLNPNIPPGVSQFLDILDELKHVGKSFSDNEDLSVFSKYIYDFCDNCVSKLNEMGHDIHDYALKLLEKEILSDKKRSKKKKGVQSPNITTTEINGNGHGLK